MTLYYIVDNVVAEKNDLPKGKRIFCINYGQGSLIAKFDEGDGPYQNVKELRKNSSPRFKELQKEDPQRAQKIFNKSFLIIVADKVFYPDQVGEELDGNLYSVLHHSTSGSFTKKNISGIHFFNPRFHRIIEITKKKNSKGIWEAKIEGKRPATGDWITKDRPSTFFPTDWTKELLLLKIHEAFMNKKAMTDLKYVGQTNCGIDIVFIIEENKVVSVYPEYE
jgi:hypothetical protein